MKIVRNGQTIKVKGNNLAILSFVVNRKRRRRGMTPMPLEVLEVKETRKRKTNAVTAKERERINSRKPKAERKLSNEVLCHRGCGTIIVIPESKIGSKFICKTCLK